MTRRSSLIGILALALILQVHSPVGAQTAPSWSACKTDKLSTYNCASYYTGTVTLAAELKTPNGVESRSITATIVAGRVTCRVKGATEPAFEGAGMLLVEHASTTNSGEYTIRVWCPDAPGEKPSGGDAATIDSYERQAASYGVLEGKDQHEHPEADAANGVSGTETITWALRR